MTQPGKTRAEQEAELAKKMLELEESEAQVVTESEKLAEKSRKLKRRISGDLSVPDASEVKP